MENTSFLLIDESVLPEVYQKVIRVNQLLETGEASNTSEAVKMVGISLSLIHIWSDPPSHVLGMLFCEYQPFAMCTQFGPGRRPLSRQ